jgi:hypothetical protein
MVNMIGMAAVQESKMATKKEIKVADGSWKLQLG